MARHNNFIKARRIQASFVIKKKKNNEKKNSFSLMARPSSHFLAQELGFWWLLLILLKIKAAFSFNAAVYLTMLCREMHYSPWSTLCCNTNILMTWHQALSGIRETKRFFIVLYGSKFHWKHHGTNMPLTCLECVSSLSERSTEALPVPCSHGLDCCSH